MEEDTLYPAGYEDEVIEPEDLNLDEPIGYRPGVAFDWETGDFIRDGRQRLLEATGVESWQQWCMNCLQTQRYKHQAYSSDFGIDVDEVFRAEFREESESILTRQITEALQADPYGRTEYVAGINYVWPAADAIEATVTVVGIADVTIDVTAYITND